MTEDNRRANIEAEWRRVETSMAAARLLLASDLHSDSVSRAYYAVFHAATCLLLTLGLEPRSHRGLARLFNQHFIGSGLVDASFSRSLARMQKYREEADYNPFAVFDSAAAREELEAAEIFVRETETRLRVAGWL